MSSHAIQLAFLWGQTG